MASQSLLVDINDHNIATITLNRPEVHNALNDQLIEELLHALEKINQDPAIRVVLLTGAGKSFCAGADIHDMQRMAQFSEQENMADARQLSKLMQTLYELSKPTIALVHGAAYGGGIGLVACCDMALATFSANFCFSEVKLGLIPAMLSSFVIAAIGSRAARRYFLTAERFNAQTALQLGLISAVVEESQLENTAQKLAMMLLQNGPQAITATKQLINDVEYRPIDANLLADVAKRIADIRVSPEGQAGLKAFLNKQNPPWISSTK